MRARMIAVGLALRDTHGTAFAAEFLAQNGLDRESALRVLRCPVCCQ